MIIHTGLRTDIPAFYSEWFLNRIRAGEVLVRNPYNEKFVSKYILNPELVDVICFCTKNPSPLLKDEAVRLLNPFRQFWFVTITPYGKAYEPNVPEKSEVIESFRKLSSVVGKENVSWRYDPVFVQGKYSVEQHKKSFEKICRELSGFTTECVVSFIEIYGKVKRNFPEVGEVRTEAQEELTAFFSETAELHGIRLKLCCGNPELSRFGADISGCMTKEIYERAAGGELVFPENGRNRKECSCFLSCDIGAYNTCAHFCKYCYANYDRKSVLCNMSRHNPESPLLIGELNQDDVVHQSVQFSWKTGQNSFPF